MIKYETYRSEKDDKTLYDNGLDKEHGDNDGNAEIARMKIINMMKIKHMTVHNVLETMIKHMAIMNTMKMKSILTIIKMCNCEKCGHEGSGEERRQ